MRKISFCSLVLACVVMLPLSSCGGGNQTQVDENIIACTIQNCTESDSIVVSDIRAYYVVTQGGSDLHVAASLGQTSNLLTVVQPNGGDSISASVGSQSAVLSDVSGNRTAYATDFNDSDAQPSVTVNFNRSGTSYPSTVTLPRQFSLLSPGPTSSVTRDMGSFTVELGLTDDSLLSAGMNAQCTRLDGTSFSGSGILSYGGGGTVSGGTSFQVDLNMLDNEVNSMGQAINTANPDTSQVANCDLQISWTLTQKGQVSPSLYGHSTILGQTSVQHEVHYDAQR